MKYKNFHNGWRQILATMAITALVAGSAPFSGFAAAVLSESFGTGSTVQDISGWDEDGNDSTNGSHAKSFEASGNDSVSPDGGRFAKIYEEEWMCRTITATGFNNLKLAYHWRGDADSGSASDDGIVEYKAGTGTCDVTGWTELKNHDLRQDASWTSQTAFDLPDTLDNTSFRIRFRAANPGNDEDPEYFRIDGVNFTGDTIVVTPATATLTVTKVVVNDDEGTKTIVDFPLTINGMSVTSGVATTTAPGTYTVAESNADGYTATFSGDCNSSGIVTLAAGETKSCTITNNDNEVVNTAPVITLNGSNPLALNVGDTYTDPGATALDSEDGDISGDIVVGGDTVNTASAGSYTVTYNVTDSGSLAAAEVTRTVNVIEVEDPNTAPVITLTGPSSVSLTVGDVYLDEGATASDSEDGDITSSISTDNPVNTSVAGTYTVRYNVTDSGSLAAAEVTRTVIVRENNVPVITLNGSNPFNLNVGDTYTEAGATANDTEDGDISSSIVVGGDVVNTSLAGTYDVTYNVTDSHGAAAVEVTRTVVVSAVPVENTAELCSDEQDNDGDEAVDLNDSDCSEFIPEGQNMSPVLNILGDNPFTLTVGASYVDPGATANDAEDGDITANIASTSNVNSNVIGTYTVSYEVADSDFATTTGSRTVNVVAAEEEEDNDNGGGGSSGSRPRTGSTTTPPTLPGNPNGPVTTPGNPGAGNEGDEGNGVTLATSLEGAGITLAAATTSGTSTATTTDADDDSNLLAAAGGLDFGSWNTWFGFLILILIIGALGYGYYYWDERRTR